MAGDSGWLISSSWIWPLFLWLLESVNSWIGDKPYRFELSWRFCFLLFLEAQDLLEPLPDRPEQPPELHDWDNKNDLRLPIDVFLRLDIRIDGSRFAVSDPAIALFGCIPTLERAEFRSDFSIVFCEVLDSLGSCFAVFYKSCNMLCEFRFAAFCPRDLWPNSASWRLMTWFMIILITSAHYMQHCWPIWSNIDCVNLAL